jgi:LysM repeat protein
MVLRLFHILLSAILFFSVSVAQKHDDLPKFQQHIVRDRETASSIASDFNVKLKYFLMLNNFPDSVKLKPGQKVLIRQLKEGETVEKEGAYYATKAAVTSPPDEEKTVAKKSSATKPASTKKETETSAETSKSSPLVGPNGAKYELSGGGFHIVQKGQTFYRIALIYHLSIDELKALNNMTTTDIKVGQELKVTK